MKGIVLISMSIIVAIFIAWVVHDDNISGYSSNEVREIIKERFNCIVWIGHGSYQPLNKSSVEEFLEIDKTNKHEYDKVKWNCMDFSRTLLNNITKKWDNAAVGILIYSRNNRLPFHAVNFFIDENKMIYCVEPITDNIFWKFSGKPVIALI